MTLIPHLAPVSVPGLTLVTAAVSSFASHSTINKILWRYGTCDGRSGRCVRGCAKIAIIVLLLCVRISRQFIDHVTKIIMHTRVRLSFFRPHSVTFSQTFPQQIQDICITFIQCWTNVKDVGPTFI